MFKRSPIYVIAFLLVTSSAAFDLTLLHTNDVHARIEETDKSSGPCTKDLEAAKQCFGGMARIRTLVNERRSTYVNHTILLDAGDQFQGTLWYYTFGGTVAAEFMNIIRYDAMAIGNHEFDDGVSGLAPFIRNVTFPVLSSNMNLTNTPELRDVVKKSAVLNVSGQRIGVVGYTTTETPYVTGGTGTVTFLKELEAVQAEVDKLTAQGIKIIIALGHAGYYEDIEMARHLRDVDIVVGGHSHTFIYNGTDPSTEKAQGVYPTVVELANGEKGLVVQDYAYGKYLGEIHLRFDDAGKVTSWWGNPVLLDKSVGQDPEILSVIAKYLPLLEKAKTEVIGHTYVSLSNDKVRCRTTECNLGNLFADACLYLNLRHNNSASWSDVSMAIANGGSLRAPISVGPITVENAVFVAPFRNTVDMIEVTGQTILSMFELCAKLWSEDFSNTFAGFLQVAGMQVTYDIRRPEGQRVVEVLVTCTQCDVPRLEPIKKGSVYKLLAASFILGGGDGFTMLPSDIIKRYNLGSLDTDILINYIKKNSPITTGLQGRIRHLKDIEGDLDLECPGNAAKGGHLSSIVWIFVSLGFWMFMKM